MFTSRSALFAAFTVLGSLVPSTRVEAACSASTTLKAWGDFWVERNTSGQCFFYAQQYPWYVLAQLRPDERLAVGVALDG